MQEQKRLIKNTGIIAIGNISTKLVSFFLLPLYTSLLSTSEYGTIDYIFSIAAFCIPFVSLLMDESIFRFLIDTKTSDEKTSVISTASMLVLAGIVVFSIVGIPVMNVLRYSYTYYAISYVILNVIAGMLGALLRGIGRTDQYALFNFLLGALQVILNVIFIAVARMGISGMLIASILAQFIVSITFIIKEKIWAYIKVNAFNRKLAKEMIVYSLPLIPNKVSWTIINLSDRIVLMNILGSAATGLYAVSYKFPNLMDTVYGFFYQAWKESSARILENGQEAERNFYNTIYSYLKNFMYAIVLGMIAFMPLVFHLLINENYYDAIFYVPVLLLGTYFSNISGFYGGIFTAYKDTRIMGTTTVIAAIINLTVNLALIHWIGIYAAAGSTLIANVVVYLYRKWKVKKYVALQECPLKTAASLVATGIILALFYSENFICILCSCIIAIAYALITNKNMLLIVLKYIKGYGKKV